MRILLSNYSEITSPGGVHKTIQEIASNLAENGHEVIILQGNPLNLSYEEIYDGYKIIRVKSYFGDNFYGLSPEIYFFLKEKLNELNPDIIHLHGYHTLFSIFTIYSLVRLNSKIPIIFSPHLDAYRSSFAGKHLWKFYNLFGKKAFKKSSHIISCSNFEADNIMNDFEVSGDRLSIINHGIDVLNSDNNSIVKKGLNLIYAGHLIDRKGVNYILEILYRLIYDIKFNNVSLTIIGDGPEKNKLFSLSKKLNIEDHIIWKSFLPREDLINEIRSSDIFMLLSKSEAYGITVAESLALGTPCIIANSSALTEFSGENGCFTVEYPPDPKKVADLVLEIHKHNIRAGPLSKKIRSWNEVVKDYEKLYLGLLAGE